MVHPAADAVDHRGSPADKCKTGGWLPASLILDSFLGRYRTIAIFASVQTLGTGMLAVSTQLPQFRPPPCHAQSTTICAQASASQMAMLYASLYVIAVGTGGLKSSVSGFGTDQFDENDDKEKPEMNLFFGRFFFLVSLGTMMAVTVLSGSQKYRYKKTSGSTLIHIFQVLVAAVRKRSLQAANHKRRLCREQYWVSKSLDTLFNNKTILISLAVYDLFIIPALQYWIGKPGFSNLQRIGIGLLLSALGMAAAALAEKRRLANAKEIAQSTATQPISVFLLIPQFLLVGCGEAFIYTGQLDFFITQSPKGMKTMSTALFLTTLSLGFFLSSLLVSVVKKVTGWVGDRIDNGRLDCFYGLLAILNFINFWLFLLCAKWYRSKTTRKDLAVENVEKGEEER
ncbi:protein NRT1/ PTR FAMILY 6.2 [Sesamum angolense]|uniref:Protein NRT1/ PTR FAMILY 6.2 n=1 Tax=Sesamum angolense TaxID=2727404 RepID=A0AAE1W8T1_9LAMI|nr:protein NRT1/ PTR FAMILY 6.2 [Sesamum angolense]